MFVFRVLTSGLIDIWGDWDTLSFFVFMTRNDVIISFRQLICISLMLTLHNNFPYGAVATSVRVSTRKLNRNLEIKFLTSF